MLPAIIAAFITGLVGGTHCVGMCGGFAAANATKFGVKGAAFYNVGRWTTYMLLGAVGGLAGNLLYKLSFIGLIVAAAFLIYFGLQLGGWIPEKGIRIPGLGKAIRWSSRLGTRGQFVFGFVTAFLPCGLVYAALATAVTSGSVIGGMLAMAAFGIGTTPLLAAMGFGAFKIQSWDLRVRRVLALAVILFGTFALVMRIPDENGRPLKARLGWGHMQHGEHGGMHGGHGMGGDGMHEGMGGDGMHEGMGGDGMHEGMHEAMDHEAMDHEAMDHDMEGSGH